MKHGKVAKHKYIGTGYNPIITFKSWVLYRKVYGDDKMLRIVKR
jgi:hypothetical protein